MEIKYLDVISLHPPEPICSGDVCPEHGYAEKHTSYFGRNRFIPKSEWDELKKELPKDTYEVLGQIFGGEDREEVHVFLANTYIYCPVSSCKWKIRTAPKDRKTWSWG